LQQNRHFSYLRPHRTAAFSAKADLVDSTISAECSAAACSRNERLWNCRLAQKRGKHARKRAGRWPSAPRWGQVARDHARKTNHRGIGRVAADFVLNLIAYNVIRIPKLMAA
jgi:hypothetical protein